jgi:hypothetical protein
MDLNLLQLHGDVGGKKPKGDAVIGDVRSGKTFSNADDIGLTGTIPTRSTTAQTITPTTSNIIKSAGIYDGDITIIGDPDLATGNIKASVNIFGVVGKTEVVDTVEATSPMGAGNVLSGKIGFVNGSKITGSMPNRGTVNITPSTVNQGIASGYHSGSGVVYGDSDLIAGNIKSGANIFGVVGNVTEGYDWNSSKLGIASPTGTHFGNTWLSVTGSGFLTGVSHAYTSDYWVSVQVDGGTIYRIFLSGSSGSLHLMARFNSSVKVAHSGFALTNNSNYVSYMLD